MPQTWKSPPTAASKTLPATHLRVFPSDAFLPPVATRTLCTELSYDGAMQRRQWLKSVVASLAPAVVRATPSLEGLHIDDLTVPGKSVFTRRARLLSAGHTPPDRLLILLHGRGEADSTALALKAWSHLYGGLEAYTRLLHPPIAPILKEPRWEAERAASINAALLAQPFRGFAIVCPVTPNPAAHTNRAVLCRDYAAWLTTELIPAVRAKVPSIGDRVGLDGCSMGGALALEVLLQQPHAFRSFGTVQAAFGMERVAGYAQQLATLAETHSLPRLHLLTSSGDPYRQANERLSQRLHAANIDNVFDSIRGPHNQPWLRQMGTLAMLYWHDRAL
jgi:predicted esterase